ncbi:MAG: gamma-glutamyltransferase family protein [Acidimicrobiales bacterium]|nr:gamma-glutamyltransferase family protein [Acidimicrobiales bacterium]
MEAVRTRTFAVVTANAIASAVACRFLSEGATAADTLVATQVVLGLVEPQSSGLGGGGFVLYYDAASGSVATFDGRETAPAAATTDYLRWVGPDDRSAPRPSLRSSGRSIGVPGTVRLLEMVHDRYGSTGWTELLQPALDLATNGFAVSPRLASSIEAARGQLSRDPDTARYFLDDGGRPVTSGTRVTNPEYASTLRRLASGGADAFYRGPIAAAIVAEATDRSAGTPSAMTTADLDGYTAVERRPLCTTYRDHEVCGMANPSSGGIAVAQTLGIISNFDVAGMEPTRVDVDGGIPDPSAVHLIAEAERLAYADRDRYVADSDFVPLPGGDPTTMVDPDYLARRAALIDMSGSMGKASAGDLGGANLGGVPTPEGGTSHVSVVDSYGNAASMTTSIEGSFGSYRMVAGFMLNNQLTDFSSEPVTPGGVEVANRIEPGKRPRSSMAPTLVFRAAGAGADPSGRKLEMVVGSPGGSWIIQFVVKALVASIDWGLDPQQAASMVNFGAANSPVTNIDGAHPLVRSADDGRSDPLAIALRSLGHQVNLKPISSGIAIVARDGAGWIGGADPRREGEVMGDSG